MRPELLRHDRAAVPVCMQLLHEQLGRRMIVRRSNTYAVQVPRAPLRNAHRETLRPYLAGEAIGVRAAGEAAELHAVALGALGSRGGCRRRACC
jgi:hypothetical protein